MKRQFIIRTTCIFCALLFMSSAYAQTPKWFKKVRKAQLNIITYDASGQLLHATNGFFIDADGTAVTDYASFKNAASAVAIDESGKEWPVTHIAGASALYDVVKIHVDAKKPTALPMATTPLLKGQTLYVMPYLSSKAGIATATTIEKAETFNEQYRYYTLPIKAAEKEASCPVMNEDGEVVGLLQMAADETAQQRFAIDVNYVSSLTITAMSATVSDYRDLPIRKALPADAAQANSFIYLIGTRDTALYISYINDYIAAFPKEANGYTMKAEILADKGDYTEADATWENGLQVATSRDELLYSRSRALYAAAQGSMKLPENWTLDKALTDIDEAISLNNEPVYTALKAHILYSQKRYTEACQIFVDVNKTNLKSANYFLYAAQCQQMLGDTTAVLALQDSAVAMFTKPYVAEAAPALLMRAQTKLSMSKYREAVIDLNDYERLMRNSLNANFYYQREQAEMRCRMFQQALDDIEKATKIDPQEPLYQAELAAVYYRFNQIDEAINAARVAITLDDSFADAHRILGICLRQQGKEGEAKAALQRAIELGDEMAAKILNK